LDEQLTAESQKETYTENTGVGPSGFVFGPGTAAAPTWTSGTSFAGAGGTGSCGGTTRTAGALAPSSSGFISDGNEASKEDGQGASLEEGSVLDEAVIPGEEQMMVTRLITKACRSFALRARHPYPATRYNT